MLRFTSIFIGIIFFLSNHVLAGTIKGHVLARDTQKPLADISVILRNVEKTADQETRTNAKGEFRFSDVNGDLHSIIISHIRYQKQVRNFITVEATETKNFEFFLEPIPLDTLVNLADTVQTGKLSGIVVDENGNRPIADVNIKVGGLAIGASTMTNGTFIIPHIPVGWQRLIFSHIAYENVFVDSIRIEPGADIEIEIRLKMAVIE